MRKYQIPLFPLFHYCLTDSKFLDIFKNWLLLFPKTISKIYIVSQIVFLKIVLFLIVPNDFYQNCFLNILTTNFFWECFSDITNSGENSCSFRGGGLHKFRTNWNSSNLSESQITSFRYHRTRSVIVLCATVSTCKIHSTFQ